MYVRIRPLTSFRFNRPRRCDSRNVACRGLRELCLA